MKLAEVEEEMRTRNMILTYKKMGTLADKRCRLNLFITDPEHHQHFLKENQQAGGRPQKVVSVPASPVPPVPNTHPRYSSSQSAYQPPHTGAN